MLRWAVTAHLSWIDLQTTGTVLFIVGVVALPLAMLYTFYWTQRTGGGDGRPTSQQRQATVSGRLVACIPTTSATINARYAIPTRARLRGLTR